VILVPDSGPTARWLLTPPAAPWTRPPTRSASAGHALGRELSTAGRSATAAVEPWNAAPAPTAGSAPARGSAFCRVCTPVTCENSGGQYCGTIGDGCGRALDCGSCSEAGWECIDHVCVGPASVCKPYTCDNCSIICGKVGDGCGRALECERTCLIDQYCQDGLCYSSKPDCEPMQVCIAASGDHYCGVIGNGCWGDLDCGDNCLAGWSCVGHICVSAPPVCVPSPATTTEAGTAGSSATGVAGSSIAAFVPTTSSAGPTTCAKVSRHSNRGHLLLHRHRHHRKPRRPLSCRRPQPRRPFRRRQDPVCCPEPDRACVRAGRGNNGVHARLWHSPLRRPRKRHSSRARRAGVCRQQPAPLPG